MEAIGIGFDGDGKVVVQDEAGGGIARDRSDGAGGFEHGGTRFIFHPELEVCKTSNVFWIYHLFLWVLFA